MVHQINPCLGPLPRYRQFHKTAFLFLLASIFTAYTQGQPANYAVAAHFTNDNGLPQNSINGLAQDENGFVWLSTYGGLVRYDGQNLRLYNAANTPAISNSSLGYVAYNNHQLIVTPTTAGGQLIKVTGSQHFSPYATPPNTVYCTTHANEVTNFGGQVPNFLKKLLPTLGNTERAGFFAWRLRVTAWPGKQNGYVETGDTIWYYNGDKGNICLKGDGINKKHFLFDNRLYVLQPGKGLTMWNGGQLAKAMVQPFLQRLLADSKVITRVFTRGRFVFIVQGENLYQIEDYKGVLQATLVSSHITMADITHILYLPEQSLLLIGTTATGLFVLKQKPFTSLLYQYPKDFVSYLPQNSLYALYAINDSSLLTTFGIITTHGTSKVYKNFEWNLRTFVRLPNGTVLLSGGNKIYQTNDAFENLRPLTMLPAGTMSTFLLQQDTLYMALDTILVKMIIKDRQFIKVAQLLLPGHTITRILKTGSNELHVATSDGLYQMQCNLQKASLVKGLEHASITILYKSIVGDIWLSTLANGAYRYNKNGLVKMPLDSKGYLARVHAFTEDSSGYMWMPTNNGMFRFLSSDLHRYESTATNCSLFYNYFDKSYGSITSEYNGNCTPAMAAMKDGSYFFPSIQGLVHFYPNNIALEQPNKALILEDIYVDTLAINEENPLIKAGFNTMNLHITTSFYGNRYNLQMEYRLSGGAANWTRLDDNGNIRFSRLAPGNYTLTVRKLSGYGKDNCPSIEFTFVVAPYWYQKLWFAVLLLVVIGLGCLFYIRKKAKKITEQNKLLETKVQSRTLELKQTMEALGQTVSELKTSEAKLKQTSEFKQQVTSLVLHDIKSPLNYLDKITESMYASSKTVAPEALTEKLHDLHIGVKEISGYAQQLLTWVTLQQEGFIVRKTNINLHALLQNKINFYSPLASQKGICIYFTSHTNLTINTQPDLLKIILRNLIDNAIKYTEKGHIHLSAVADNNKILLSVADTGVGMPPVLVQQLLATDCNLTMDQQPGLGYRFINDILKKMEGRLFIDSELGLGTTVRIVL